MAKALIESVESIQEGLQHVANDFESIRSDFESIRSDFESIRIALQEALNSLGNKMKNERKMKKLNVNKKEKKMKKPKVKKKLLTDQLQTNWKLTRESNYDLSKTGNFWIANQSTSGMYNLNMGKFMPKEVVKIKK